MGNNKVLIAAPVHRVLTDGLTDLGYECIMYEDISQSVAYGLIAGCVGVITSTRLQLDKDLLDAAPLLQWIGRMGSGMEVIDVPYATARGIACYSSPEGNRNAVGEHALGMLLSVVRRISWSHGEMNAGIWLREENRGTELEGKTIAIIGFGHTGRAFAKKLSGFDMRILAFDKQEIADKPAWVEVATLDEVFEQADIVSFHVPLQPDTIGYFDKVFIQSMRKPFILINTSRGKVVNTIALYEGLVSGKITGACLDVFEREPVTAVQDGLKTAISAMMQLPNVAFTPHIAGYTHEALYKMSKILLEKVGGTHK
jgi:D-3-phosphoglycerate dehydrogenase